MPVLEGSESGGRLMEWLFRVRVGVELDIA
jgi:hypothetical protein